MPKKIILLCILTLISCGVYGSTSKAVVPHLDVPSQRVEFYMTPPPQGTPQATLIFIHGHQKAPDLVGGLALLNDGTLQRYAAKGYLTIAVSLPGYGGSEGTLDWCGPYTQRAVLSVVHALKEQNIIKNEPIFLIGNSRGAVVAGMLATQSDLFAGIVLESGFYDLNAIKDERTSINLHKEAGGVEAYATRSLMDKVHAINTKVLMLHGYHDPRAPVKSALEFYHEMIVLRKKVVLMIFPVEHHVPEKMKHQAIDMFLEQALIT